MYAIWLLLDDKDTIYIKDIINELSLKFDSPKFIPHITIYGLVDIDYLTVEKIVRNSISEATSFFVRKSELKYSDNFWKSLFIDIKRNKELYLLNMKLKLELYKFNKYKFSPHISLMYKNLNKTEKVKILQNLKIKNKFRINKMAILKFLEKISEWKIVQIFHL